MTVPVMSTSMESVFPGRSYSNQLLYRVKGKVLDKKLVKAGITFQA